MTQTISLNNIRFIIKITERYDFLVWTRLKAIDKEPLRGAHPKSAFLTLFFDNDTIKHFGNTKWVTIKLLRNSTLMHGQPRLICSIWSTNFEIGSPEDAAYFGLSKVLEISI